MCILPQIAQITQRNAAGCIITQRKTDRTNETNNNNGRSHGNKIQKLRKYLASKSKAKLA